MIKYGQYPNPETESEFDVDKEIKTEEDIDPLAIDNYDKENETTSIDIIDPLTKIEIEEDLILKTESSDLFDFIDQCNKEDAISEGVTLLQDVNSGVVTLLEDVISEGVTLLEDANSEDEMLQEDYIDNLNPAIRAEFFPQLC